MEVVNKIEKWAEERNFFGEGGATLEGQILKYTEELGEFAGDALRGRCVKDSIGDVFVVLTIIARMQGFSMYKIIKDNDEAWQCCNWTATNEHYKTTDLPTHAVYTLGFCVHIISCIVNGRDITEAEIASTVAMLMLFVPKANTTLEECAEHAYNEIKDRKGSWVNGAFVKEGDVC